MLTRFPGACDGLVLAWRLAFSVASHVVSIFFFSDLACQPTKSVVSVSLCLAHELPSRDSACFERTIVHLCRRVVGICVHFFLFSSYFILFYIWGV